MISICLLNAYHCNEHRPEVYCPVMRTHRNKYFGNIHLFTLPFLRNENEFVYQLCESMFLISMSTIQGLIRRWCFFTIPRNVILLLCHSKHALIVLQVSGAKCIQLLMTLWCDIYALEYLNCITYPSILYKLIYAIPNLIWTNCKKYQVAF